jgi:translation elongation factor EF-4
MELKRAPAGRKPCGAGKKKMRSLGTVQMPTEAFMAVLKLDDEG